jgi:hypothetical protein
MGYFQKLAKNTRWSGKHLSTPQAGDSIHFSHPEHGTVSVVKDGGQYHVKHNGAHAGILNQKGIFNTPKEAVQHAKDFMAKLGSGGHGNAMHNMPSAQSMPSKPHLQAPKNDVFGKAEGYAPSAVDSPNFKIGGTLADFQAGAQTNSFSSPTPIPPVMKDEKPNYTRNIWHPKRLDVGSHIMYQGKKHKVVAQHPKPDNSANFKEHYHTTLLEVKDPIKKEELDKSTALERHLQAKGKSKNQARAVRSRGNPKGVHLPIDNKGISSAGAYATGRIRTADENFNAVPKSQDVQHAKSLHSQKLRELRAMPKPDLGKARQEEDLSSRQKVQVRHARSEKPIHPFGTNERFHPEGRNTQMGQIARNNKLRAFRKQPKPDLGKKESKLAFLFKHDYFNLFKTVSSPVRTKTIMDCPEDHDIAVNQKFESMIMDRLAQFRKDESENPAQPDKPAETIAGTPKKQQSRSYDLFTDEMANAKTAKSGKRGEFLSAILHLAPADLAGGKDVCPFATDGCRHACLNTSGRGGMLDREYDLNDIQLARIRKTKEFHDSPHAFLSRISRDIEKLKRYAKADGRRPVVRLNGTSDINWAALKSPNLKGQNIFDAHPDVQFYDYTKNPYIVKNNKHPNYHVTFSYADGAQNQGHAKELLAQGHNVAVVFGGKKDGQAIFPKKFNGHDVVSGDETDLRFLDPKGGKIVGLSAKADAMRDTTGFVQWGHEGEPDAVPRPKTEKDRYERVKQSGEAKVEAFRQKKLDARAAKVPVIKSEQTLLEQAKELLKSLQENPAQLEALTKVKK